MLPKLHRLPGYRIPEILKTGRRFHADIATIVVTKNSEPASRFAVSVSTRLSKKATARNRTKRLLREALFTNLSAIQPGYDGIVFAKKLLLEEKLQDILSEIHELLKKAGLLKQE